MSSLSRASRALAHEPKPALVWFALASTQVFSRERQLAGDQGAVAPRVRVRVMLILLCDVMIQKR